MWYNSTMSEPQKLDTLIDESKHGHGGKRQGAGRREGSKNKRTLEEFEAKKIFRKRVAQHADELFHAQYDLAIGEKYLMVVRTIGKGSKQRHETSIVKDPETIKQYLDEDLEDADEEYYFMTTKPANNMALDSLLNRSFGKAEERMDITTGGGKIGESDSKIGTQFAVWLKEKTKK